MWEDANLWAHRIPSFHMHLSYLGPDPVSLFPLRSSRCGRWLLLASPHPPGHLRNHRGGWGNGICWIAALGALIHVWRPEVSDGCDIPCLLIWQEILRFHTYIYQHITKDILYYICQYILKDTEEPGSL